MSSNLHEQVSNWSFDSISLGVPDIPKHEVESNQTNEQDSINSPGSERPSYPVSMDHTTSYTTASLVNNEEMVDEEANEATEPEAGEVHSESGDRDNEDILMEGTVAQHNEEWNPTEAELYAIAFADDDDIEPRHETDVDHNEDNQNAEPHIEPQDQLVGEGAQHATDDTTNDENPDTIEIATNPQPQNPWGMSEAQIEQLIVDQDRIFGYIRDRSSGPKPFTCPCGESSMDPSIFINLTCPDNCVRCIDCLNANVRVGLESRKKYPPKCCIPIDFENVIDDLEPDLIDRWLEVAPEYEDIAPVYCAVNVCSLYLPKSTFTEEGKWAICTKCDVQTCTSCLCLQCAHDDSNACPERLEKMDQELIKRKRWKACPQCKEMIERTEGCDHMICECGQEFCYGCGRSYTPPYPCNCHGQNRWVEDEDREAEAEADPARQREILEEIGEPVAGHVGQLVEQWEARAELGENE